MACQQCGRLCGVRQRSPSDASMSWAADAAHARKRRPPNTRAARSWLLIFGGLLLSRAPTARHRCRAACLCVEDRRSGSVQPPYVLTFCLFRRETASTPSQRAAAGDTVPSTTRTTWRPLLGTMRICPPSTSSPSSVSTRTPMPVFSGFSTWITYSEPSMRRVT